jgi:photosystem II stability/assembly factor-like uncharacterized protein
MKSWRIKVGLSIAVVGLALAISGCGPQPPAQSGVFVTRDSGSSWTSTPDLKARGAKKPKVFPPLAINAVGVSPGSPDLVVSGSDDDIFQATDGGRTWERLTERLPTATKAMAVQVVAFHPTLPDTYYVGGVSGGYGKVIKTADRGRTLQDVFTVSKPGQAVTSIAIADNGTLFVGDQLGSVYRSNDGGGSWQRVFSLTEASVTSLAASGADLYVGTTGQGVWRSVDGGAIFHPVNGNLTGKQLSVWTLATGFGGLYVGTEEGVFVTRNFGGTWQSIGNPLPVGGQRIQAMAISGPSLYFATNAVVYKTTPAGDQFAPVQLKLARNVFSLAATGAGTNTLFAGANSQQASFPDRFNAGLPGIKVRPLGSN